MKKEIWKDIIGYEGLYQVSDLGNIRSLPKIRDGKFRNEYKILKPRKVKDGYLMVALYKDKKAKNVQIHRIVAKHFLENYDDKLEVNHKDFNKGNNSLDNIEMITHIENIKHYWKGGVV